MKKPTRTCMIVNTIELYGGEVISVGANTLLPQEPLTDNPKVKYKIETQSLNQETVNKILAHLHLISSEIERAYQSSKDDIYVIFNGLG